MLEQNQEMIDNSVQDQTKVVSLFQFIRELNKLKQKAIVNYAEYPWARTVSSLPDDPDNISVFYRDRVENDDSADDGNILLAASTSSVIITNSISERIDFIYSIP